MKEEGAEVKVVGAGGAQSYVSKHGYLRDNFHRIVYGRLPPVVSIVTFIRVSSAGISSVADNREGEAQGHDRRGDQEDDQAQLASRVAPGLARQPTKDDASSDEPDVPHPRAS
jgi:hypothetical protein